MKQHGYFLISIKKTITLYLWSMSKEHLEELMKRGRQIVPCFKNDIGDTFIKVQNQLIKIS